MQQGLYRSIVEMEESLRTDEEDGPDVLTNREIRFRLYRHATAWIHGFLGKGKRIKLPLCVSAEIVDIAPKDAGDSYTGFKRSRDDDNGGDDENHEANANIRRKAT